MQLLLCMQRKILQRWCCCGNDDKNIFSGRLSDFARHGTIWTTKNVVNKLDQDDLKKIRFGIQRKQHGRQVFVENSFSRIIDLLERDHRDKNKFLDIITITVTEIL